MYRLIVVSVLFLTSSFIWGQTLKTEGKRIVDDEGNEVILRGMGLGGWMLMEGYMMQSSDVADTQHEFRNRLIDLMGEEKTDEFFDAWLANHVTRPDVDSLAIWGFNSVRLAMHYNLFTLPIEEEPVEGENTWLEKGFVMVDSLLDWCEANEMYLILDLHAAPGGQGYNAAISDYDPSKPSLWESQENKDKTVALWRRLAERYKDEVWIGGYDLINEVNWDLPGNVALKELYVDITNAIREVDTTHIIFIEGNWFANDFTGLTPPWDDNMSYSFHKYWNYNDPGSIQWMLDIREQYNVPLWMGESGENSNVWFVEAISLFEANDIGWSWWPMKRIETIVSPYSILFTQGYKDILAYWRGEGPKPSEEEAHSSMMELALNANSKNCIHGKDVPDAQIRQIQSDETKPFSEQQIPGIVYFSDYDLGKLHFAYNDIDYANYAQSTGEFQAWNSGWVYRNDGVDIEANTDQVNSNGFHIGFTAKGEWLNYTLNVIETGVYSARLRVASQLTGGEFHLAIDGQDITPTHKVNSTGGWYDFEDFEIEDIALAEGEHVLTLWFDNDVAFNVGSAEFTKTGSVDDIAFEALNGSTRDDEQSVQVFVNQAVSAESLEGSMEYFSVSVNGTERNITAVSTAENLDRSINLSVEGYLLYTDKITVSYEGSVVSSESEKTLEPFTDLEIRNTLVKRHVLPKKIQAEDFYFNNGFGIEETSDVGGGYNIGYTNPGDYADYLIYAEEDKYYNLNIRVAAQNSEGSIGYYLVAEDETETELLKLTTPKTGGWQTWETITQSLSIPPGTHKLRLRVFAGEININWFEFDMLDAIDEKGDEKSLLNVYPNPVSIDYVHAQMEYHDLEKIQINICDLSGKVVSSGSYKLQNGHVLLEISGVPKGVFIINAISEHGVASRKMIRF
jgi:hypothetical protein